MLDDSVLGGVGALRVSSIDEAKGVLRHNLSRPDELWKDAWESDVGGTKALQLELERFLERQRRAVMWLTGVEGDAKGKASDDGGAHSKEADEASGGGDGGGKDEEGTQGDGRCLHGERMTADGGHECRPMDVRLGPMGDYSVVTPPQPANDVAPGRSEKVGSGSREPAALSSPVRSGYRAQGTGCDLTSPARAAPVRVCG